MAARRGLRRLGISLLVLVALVIGAAVARSQGDWRSASSEPVGLAPDPARTPVAVVQVYAARVWGWRGTFGVHTWVAAKPSGAQSWTVYEVIGWRLRWSDSSVAIRQREPDARWFGAAPELLVDKRGPRVDALIARLEAAARSYPYAHEYTMWPGPNSNTFTAYLGRSVPELELDLPPTAIGKDYLGDRFMAKTPSGTGYQVSLYGALGVLAAKVEGLEVNVLGLTFGIDPLSPALKLPLVGRLGPSR
jgi:hypothetical protein